MVSGGCMLHRILLFVSFLAIFNSVSWGADKAPIYTQKDFARLILQQFSWNDGLPKEPADRDYLMILGGKRTFRYEAENAYNELTDRVTLRDFALYGEFTGKGWLLGVSDATDATFTILLPVDGEYDFKAVIKGDGFVWNIDGKNYPADSKVKKFQETSVAKVKLKAGVVTIKLTIPPDGAIDSFSLSAPDYTSIQPFMGWRFKEALTAVRMAEIAVALANRYDQLPDAGPEVSPKPVSAFEKVDLPPNVQPTVADYLGAFASAKWVRANFQGATLKFPLTVTETGYYGLTANIMGEKLAGKVNNTLFNLEGKAYLSKINLGVYRLDSGDNSLSITLPAMGGIDNIEVAKKSTKPEDFLRLAGVPGPATRLIGADEAAALVKNIQSSFAIRK